MLHFSQFFENFVTREKSGYTAYEQIYKSNHNQEIRNV